VQTDRTIPNNKPDIIIRGHEKGTCMLIDVAISEDINVREKKAEKILKYKDFTIEIQEPGWRSRYSDSLRAGRFRDRIPVGARFSAPIQTGSGTHPASCTMGTVSCVG
jgi:hypothetical protein